MREFLYGPGPLDPALLHENGGIFTVGTSPLTKSVFVPFVTGGPDGYWRVGTGGRYKWTTSARRMRVMAWATAAGVNSVIGIRLHDGSDIVERYGPPMELGQNIVTFNLPHGVSKVVELIIPMQNATSSGGAPAGCYPYDVRFDAPAVAVAVTTPTNRLGIFTDSIGVGGNAVSPSQYGMGGLMKRGLTVQAGSKWKGAWSVATAYSVGDYVSRNRWVWKAKTAHTGVTPVTGSDWELFGYDGSVTLIGYGFRRVADDWSSSGNRSAFATAIASLGLTRLLCFIGSNDHSTVPATTLANFTAYITAGLDALNAAMPSLPIHILTPIRRSTEGTNANGNTMAQFRSEWVTAASARSGFCTSQDGLSILALTDLYQDAVHPGRSGSQKIMEALQANGNT